jgi:hypothetical protein
VAPLDKAELAVGDSARLEVIFLTGKRNGLQTKSPLIQTTYNDSAYFYVQIRANVIPDSVITTPLNITPRRLYFANAAGSENDITTVTYNIGNNTDSTVYITLVDWPRGLITGTLPKNVSGNFEVECRAWVVDPDFSEGFFKSQTIECRRGERFTIPLVGRVLP